MNFEVSRLVEGFNWKFNEKDYESEGGVAVVEVYHYLRYVCTCDYTGGVPLGFNNWKDYKFVK